MKRCIFQSLPLFHDGTDAAYDVLSFHPQKRLELSGKRMEGSVFCRSAGTHGKEIILGKIPFQTRPNFFFAGILADAEKAWHRVSLFCQNKQVACLGAKVICFIVVQGKKHLRILRLNLSKYQVNRNGYKHQRFLDIGVSLHLVHDGKLFWVL